MRNGAGMSEPMTSVEIEDVLSSIRRLVSDDLRPAAAAPGSAAAPATRSGDPAEPAAAADKLILTPALRVVAEPAPMGQMVAGLGAAVDARPEEWESETGDAAPDEIAEAPAGALAPPPRARLHLAEAMRVDPAAPPEADEGEGDEPWPALAAEAAAEPVPAPAAAGPLIDRLVDVMAEEILARTETTDDVLPAAAAPDVPGWAQEGEDDPAEPEPAAAMVEPDIAWADAAEAEALEELSDAGPAAAAPHPQDASYLQDDYGLPPGLALDEEALRDLVRELIVEELQGPLGERITRNIRKLVRAEIARALAADQLI